MISEISITPRIAANPNANLSVAVLEAIQTTRATFQNKNAKLYVNK